jgi:hypothetical protein
LSVPRIQFSTARSAPVCPPEMTAGNDFLDQGDGLHSAPPSVEKQNRLRLDQKGAAGEDCAKAKFSNKERSFQNARRAWM